MQTSVTVESGDVKKTENAQTDNSDKKENDSSGSEETRQGEYALSEIEIPATTENTDVGEGSKQETSAANTPSSEKADDESKGDDISMMSSEMGTTESESPNGNNEPSTTVPSEETQGIIVDGNGDVLFPEIP